MKKGIADFITRDTLIVGAEYRNWLSELKTRYRQAQIKAAVKVNSELLQFYWSLGRDIVARKAEAVWGKGFLKNLSIDLQREFPESSGLSYSNLKYARQWYSFYHENIIKAHKSSSEFRQQPVGELEIPSLFLQIGWSHHIVIISKVKNFDEALFYIRLAVSEGMSRNTLVHSIEADEYKARGNAVTNFNNTLPVIQGELAKEILKSPYNFDFLQMSKEYDEHSLEESLARHITEFLLELGRGFSYVGRQIELVMPSGKSYKVDMLFYHIKLHCYVVVELKVVDFEPEFVGKLNFYVSAVDEILKGVGDNPTIGLLICKKKDDTVVEWAFRGLERPIGVAEYENELKKLTDTLPTVEQIKTIMDAEKI